MATQNGWWGICSLPTPPGWVFRCQSTILKSLVQDLILVAWCREVRDIWRITCLFGGCRRKKNRKRSRGKGGLSISWNDAFFTLSLPASQLGSLVLWKVKMWFVTPTLRERAEVLWMRLLCSFAPHSSLCKSEGESSWKSAGEMGWSTLHKPCQSSSWARELLELLGAFNIRCRSWRIRNE